MLKFRDRQLDERQRMVRDSAHRTAYKIITLLCLLIPLYLAAQGFFARPPVPTHISSPNYTTVMQPGTPYTGYVRVVTGNIQPPAVFSGTKLHAIDTKTMHIELITLWRPFVIWQVQPAPMAPAPVIVTPNPGVYYGLVLLTLLLIISTLPKAIVAWQER